MGKFYYLPLMVCLLSGCSLFAQEEATIVGTVSDPSGAAVPQAHVSVQNPAKAFMLSLNVDSAGAYTAARVPIGDYEITVDAPGFKRIQRSGVSLTVGQTLRLDFKMELGNTTQSVTIVGNAPQVNTESGTVSSLITGHQIAELNLNNRNFTNLVLLTPGAAPTSGYDPTTMGLEGSDQVPINGVSGNYNNFEFDGVTMLDQGNGASSLLLFPSLDAIAEFRISNSNYSAEYSKTAGSMIELVSKSGTNKFHGDLYDYLRNDVFDANDWFANRQIAPPGGNAPKTPLKWNDFGFTLGGPIFIPGVYNTSRTKTFFFVSEEWRRQRQGTVVSSQTPTMLMRNGDFSECDPASPNFNSTVASGCVSPPTLRPAARSRGILCRLIRTPMSSCRAWSPSPITGLTGTRGRRVCPRTSGKTRCASIKTLPTRCGSSPVTLKTSTIKPLFLRSGQGLLSELSKRPTEALANKLSST